MSTAPDERDRIHAAMDRILTGVPERSNGALTIVALAAEAGVPRNALTQWHLDLKNEFYAKVRARGEMPDNEKRLRRQLVKAKELRAQALQELEQLKTDNAALVAALHQITMENRQLRLQLAERPTNIHVLPTQPRPPAR
ncbi:hypothetical protein ACWEKM_41495 [Streptomyces sp. NPDC004752]